MTTKGLKIGVVGPCSAGKTTLIAGLKMLGYRGIHIAQEHSYVPDMWQKITNPDVLVYLHVSYPLTKQRRNLNWTLNEYTRQVDRLKHAYANADIYINTDSKQPEEILEEVCVFLVTTGNN
jgi:hypothetical protein